MDDDNDIEMTKLPARRFHTADLLVIGAGLMAGIADNFCDAFAECRQVAAMHVNWEFYRDQFHEQAAQEIEKIVGDDNG